MFAVFTKKPKMTLAEQKAEIISNNFDCGFSIDSLKEAANVLSGEEYIRLTHWLVFNWEDFRYEFETDRFDLEDIIYAILDEN